MLSITFLFKDGRTQTVQAQENFSIMETAQLSGIAEIPGKCGGCISCASCHVYIHPDWVERVEDGGNEKSDAEEDLLYLEPEARETSRLGCQIKLSSALNGLIVALPGTETDW